MTMSGSEFYPCRYSVTSQGSIALSGLACKESAQSRKETVGDVRSRDFYYLPHLDYEEDHDTPYVLELQTLTLVKYFNLDCGQVRDNKGPSVRPLASRPR